MFPDPQSCLPERVWEPRETNSDLELTASLSLGPQYDAFVVWPSHEPHNLQDGRQRMTNIHTVLFITACLLADQPVVLPGILGRQVVGLLPLGGEE